jgi:hypothetical protein
MFKRFDRQANCVGAAMTSQSHRSGIGRVWSLEVGFWCSVDGAGELQQFGWRFVGTNTSRVDAVLNEGVLYLTDPEQTFGAHSWTDGGGGARTQDLDLGV